MKKKKKPTKKVKKINGLTDREKYIYYLGCMEGIKEAKKISLGGYPIFSEGFQNLVGN